MKYSYVIIEGYEKNKVFLGEVIKKYIPNPDDLNGVKSVDALPDTGEEGRIYYNTTDKCYYYYSIGEYKSLATIGEVDTAVRESTFMKLAYPSPIIRNKDNVFYDEYSVAENTYSVLGTVGAARTVDVITTSAAVFAISFKTTTLASGTTHSVTGRFTVDENNTGLSIYLDPGIYIPDDNDFTGGTGFEAGHTYEFNILHDVCLFSDITYTPQSLEPVS